MARLLMLALVMGMITIPAPGEVTGEDGQADRPGTLSEAFRPPAEFREDFGDYRSPLRFDDGRPVRDAADWRRRREEILSTWHEFMGRWPALIERPAA